MNSTHDVIECEEHDDISSRLSQELEFREQPKDGSIAEIWALGLQRNGCLSYYIGLDWLEAGRAIHASPKVTGMDYLTVFKRCLESSVASRWLGDVYDVRIDKEFIAIPNEKFDIMPLVVLHYFATLEDLFKKPLKKGYLSREENLTAKMKGKILISSHIKRNVLGSRPDRIMCRFQEYSSDCLENRLLHSAYRIGRAWLRRWRDGEDEYSIRHEVLEGGFTGIGYADYPMQGASRKANPIYREYGDALRLARLICRVQGYRDQFKQDGQHLVPPHVIDMAKLFELYVYAELDRALGKAILFQVVGKGGGIVDFLDIKNRVVIDAKYKTIYETGLDMDNMRQVAGYARNASILAKLGIPRNDWDQVVDCLIIYPVRNGTTLSARTYIEGRVPIDEYHRVWKLGIPVPMKKAS